MSVLDDAVEEIAVDDPQTLARERGVEGFAAHVDVTESEVAELSRSFVMIAGNVDHLRAFAGFAQHFLDHVVVRLRPEPAFAELPSIDDVTDQIEVLRIVMAQKIEQIVRLAAAGAEMDIGQPDGPVAMVGRAIVGAGSGSGSGRGSEAGAGGFRGRRWCDVGAERDGFGIAEGNA